MQLPGDLFELEPISGGMAIEVVPVLLAIAIVYDTVAQGIASLGFSWSISAAWAPF